MKDFITIFKYTFYDNLRKKTFIISTIVTLLLIVGGITIGTYVMSNKSDNKSGTNKSSMSATKDAVIYLVDKEQVISKNIQELKTIYKNYDISIKNENEISNLKKSVKADSKKMLMVISKRNDLPYIDYYIKNSDTNIDTYNLTKTVKSIYSAKLLKDIKATPRISQLILQDAAYNVNELKKGRGQNAIIAMAVSFIIFYAVYFYSYSVALSVSSEKSSRVMELLVTSTKPSIIILGKSLSVGLLGLCQLVLIIGTALASVSAALPDEYDSLIKGLASNSIFVLVMIAAYFVFGYFIYAMINAVVGATVSKSEDLHSALMPVSIVIIMAFYMGYASLFNPDSKLAVVSSMIPLTAPFTIPCRLLVSEVPAIQIITSVAVMIISIVVITIVSIKLYSRAVLHYGGRLKLGMLFKMKS